MWFEIVREIHNTETRIDRNSYVAKTLDTRLISMFQNECVKFLVINYGFECVWDMKSINFSRKIKTGKLYKRIMKTMLVP